MTMLYFTLSTDLHNTTFNVLTKVPAVKHQAGFGSRDPNSIEYSYTLNTGSVKWTLRMTVLAPETAAFHDICGLGANEHIRIKTTYKSLCSLHILSKLLSSCSGILSLSLRPGEVDGQQFCRKVDPAA